LKWSNDKPIHLSFDIDAVDPMFAPATGTLSRGGLTEREAQFLNSKLYESRQLVGMDMVEINPTLEKKEREEYFGDSMHFGFPIKGTPTVALGMELVVSAFGYKSF
jgi:arginase